MTSTDKDGTRMLLDISFPMNYVTIDQLASNLVDISLGNTLQIFCNSLICFKKIGKIDHPKIAKTWLVKFCMPMTGLELATSRL